MKGIVLKREKAENVHNLMEDNLREKEIKPFKTKLPKELNI